MGKNEPCGGLCGAVFPSWAAWLPVALWPFAFLGVWSFSRAGIELKGLSPFGYLAASQALLAGMTWAGLRVRRPLAGAFLFGLGAWLCYAPLSVPARFNTGDNFWYAPAARSWIRERNVELSEYEALLASADPGRIHWAHAPEQGPPLVRLPRGAYQRGPLGVTLAVMPFVLIGEAWGGMEDDVLGRLLIDTVRAGRFYAALAVGLLFFVLRRLGMSRPLCVLLALVYAVGSPHLSMHAGAPWSHAVAAVLLLGAVALLAADRAPALAGILCAALVFVRPGAIAAAAGLAFVSIRSFRGSRAAFPAGLVLGIALFLGMTRWAYGLWLPPSIGRQAFGLRYLPEAFAGHLVSPARGILVYFPILLFAVFGWRGGAGTPLPACRIGWIVLPQFVALCLFRHWYAGHAYGPRYVCDILPLLMVLIGYGLTGLSAKPAVRRRAVWFLAALSIGWGQFVHLKGALDPAVHQWNGQPRDVVQHPERLWDWRDPPFLRQAGSAGAIGREGRTSARGAE